jgi:head decoration protein D
MAAKITITNNDLGSVELEGAILQDELINFAGADVFAPGTILARDSSTLKLRLFVKGGSTNGNGVPKAVLAYEVDAAGAGDVKARVIVKGHVNRNRLIIDADGDGSAIDGAVLDQLRDYGIVASTVKQLADYDNQ